MNTESPSILGADGAPVNTSRGETSNERKMRLAREAAEAASRKQEAKPLTNARPLKTRMLGSRILVQPAEAASVSAEGIVIPDQFRKNPPYGVVIAVGEGWRDLDNPSKMTSIPLEKGETVMYGPHTGTEIVINGNTFLHMRYEDVIAVFEEDPDAEIIDNRPDMKYESRNEIPLANGEVDPLAESDAIYEDQLDASSLDQHEDTLG